MFQKLLLVASFLLVSSAANAAIIEHNGYSRNESSNIVTGGGLEWLQWNVTKNMSVAKALAAHSDSGWVLATSTQMAGLFNAFMFGDAIWQAGDTRAHSDQAWNSNEDSAHRAFISLFGVTDSDDSRAICTPIITNDCYIDTDRYEAARALYLVEPYLGQVHMSSLASVRDDYTFVWDVDYRSNTAHRAIMDSKAGPAGWAFYGTGVALVRTSDIQPSPVNLPNTFGLLVLSFSAFAYLRRKVVKI